MLRISFIPFSSLLFWFFCSVSVCKAQQPEDFSFLTGSCAYISPSEGDTSYYLYRGDTSIFYSMSRKDADFMLWLGDNWYLSDDECTTPEGLWGKAHYARTVKTLQPLLSREMPAYAIWDDHDYGPNQSQKNFPLKEVSRNIFMDTWKANPSYGENGEGIYTSFRKNDVAFILLDDRWWRDYDRLWDYKWFRPNPDKRMFGQQQMDWLKKKLLEDTTASFKIIVNGSQMLNPWAKDDCFIHFPIEYYDLLDFIAANRINGVIFLSGDRHYSEIIRLPREGHYPLYDVTVSPFTSTPDPVKGREKHNIYRVPGSYIPTYNFARYTVSGDEANRKLKVEFFDKNGKLLNEWQVMSSELRDE